MSVTLIYGENDYEASEFYKETLAEFIKSNSEQSLSVFDGENSSATEVEEALNAQSLFTSGLEMVAIKRLGANTQLKDKLMDLLNDIPKQTELILYEPKIDKRSKLFKLLKKSYSTKEFNKLSHSELIRWINNLSLKKGGQLEAGSANLLIESTKGDQLRLANELGKLLSYDSHITVNNVKLLVEKTPDDNIFDLLDLVAQGKKTFALAKYEELRAAQVDAHYILVMISWQVANFLAVGAGVDRPDREIASQLGMNPYAVSKTRQIVRNISKKQLKKMASTVLSVDTKLKTTSVDADQLVKQLIAQL